MASGVQSSRPEPQPVRSGRSATIRDVARHAGVSVSTVSRALNGKTKAVWNSSSQRVADIHRIARQIGYQPNSLSQALVSGKSTSIGLVTNPLGHWAHFNWVRALEHRAHNAGYLSYIINADMNRLEDAVKGLMRRRVDGMVILHDWMPARVCELIESSDVPAVFLRHVPAQARFGVRMESESARREIADHLVAFGHRRAILICARSNLDYPHCCLNSYRRACEGAGIELVVDPDWMVPDDHVVKQSSHVRQRVRHVSGLPEDVTAVIASNDELAQGVVAGLADIGLSVPADASVVGFGDAPFSRNCLPALTTVRRPVTASAEAAMRLLLAAIDDPDHPPSTESFTCEFIPRESTGPAPAMDRGLRRAKRQSGAL